MKKSAGQKTKEKILKAGLKLWPNVNLYNVGKMANLTPSAVFYHFPDGTLKDAVAEHAVDVGESRIIIQLLGDNHPAINKISRAG